MTGLKISQQKYFTLIDYDTIELQQIKGLFSNDMATMSLVFNANR